MQDEMEKIEEIRRRVGVSYEEAHYALEEAGGDLAEAVAIAERDRETAGAGLAAAGMAFLDEMKQFVSGGELRLFRLKFGSRTIREFSVSPRTALAALGLAALAVAVTKLRVEVEREPEQESRALPQSPRYEVD